MTAPQALVARVRGLLAKATPGPWKPPRPSEGSTAEITRVVWTVDGEQMVAQALSLHDVPEEEGHTQETALRNAELIASAPTDLAALCDAVERLDGVLQEIAQTDSPGLGGYCGDLARAALGGEKQG